VTDPRVERYAALLIDTCLGVEAAQQVIVWGMPLARPSIEEVTRRLGQRRAYPLLRLTFGGGLVYHRDWIRHAAPLEVIAEPAPIDVHAFEHCDGLIAISAPELVSDAGARAGRRDDERGVRGLPLRRMPARLGG
jgi:leucyl aminopeptidase (aminopeptidase T)